MPSSPIRSASAPRAGSWERTDSRARWAAGDEAVRVDGLRVLGVARKGGVPHLGGRSQRFGVPEALGLRRQFGVLACHRFHRGDLVQAEAQQVRLLGAFPGPGGDLLQLDGDRAEPAVGRAVLLQRDGDRVPGVPVEGLPLPGGPQQPLLVGLAVHGDQVVRELAEQPHGHGAAAHVGPRAALGGHGAADQQGAVVELGPGLLGAQGGRCVRAHDEAALDDRGLGPDPYEGRVGTTAEQQPEAGDDHRLARAGLAGHRGETGRQLDHRVVDDPERPYPHLLKHGTTIPRFHGCHATSPAPSFPNGCAIRVPYGMPGARANGAPHANRTPAARTSRRAGP